jgi:hypothetical protein
MPTRLRDTSNTDFPSLKATENNHIMRYNSSIDSFDLVSIDSITSISSEDGNTPNDFIDTLEQEIDPNNMTFLSIDGGSF